MPDSTDQTGPAGPTRRPDGTQSGPSRRTLIRATGLIALTGGGAAVLAACGADAGTAQPPAAPSAASSAAPLPTTASATPDVSTSGKPSASAPKEAPKARSGPSVPTSDVPVGGGVILENANYVVTQPTRGTYKAFTKICTHMGCPVTSIANGNIHCNCHGSEYSITDGSVTHPPAPRPLQEFATTVIGKKVYITG
jgi:Rieske Fe-S protein